jgi:hypothetical protein
MRPGPLLTSNSRPSTVFFYRERQDCRSVAGCRAWKTPWRGLCTSSLLCPAPCPGSSRQGLAQRGRKPGRIPGVEDSRPVLQALHNGRLLSFRIGVARRRDECGRSDSYDCCEPIGVTSDAPAYNMECAQRPSVQMKREAMRSYALEPLVASSAVRATAIPAKFPAHRLRQSRRKKRELVATSPDTY